MDLNTVGSFFTEYVLKQWPFFFVGFLIGVAGQVFKTRIWTIQRAREHKFFWWMRALMPFHAPATGFVVGCLFWWLFKEKTPTGPGIDGGAAVVLYYTGAGAASSWLVGAFKHLLEFRFGVKPPSELDDFDSLAPPPEQPLGRVPMGGPLSIDPAPPPSKPPPPLDAA
jgi:hypothetical protein